MSTSGSGRLAVTPAGVPPDAGLGRGSASRAPEATRSRVPGSSPLARPPRRAATEARRAHDQDARRANRQARPAGGRRDWLPVRGDSAAEQQGLRGGAGRGRRRRDWQVRSPAPSASLG